MASGRGHQPQDRDEATSPPKKKKKDVKFPKKPQYVDEDGKPCSKDYYTGHNATWTREDEELLIKLRSYPDTHKKLTVHSDRNLGMWAKVAKDFNSMVPERRREVGSIQRHFSTLWGKYRNWKLLHTTNVSGMSREEKKRRIMNKHLWYFDIFKASVMADPPQGVPGGVLNPRMKLSDVRESMKEYGEIAGGRDGLDVVGRTIGGSSGVGGGADVDAQVDDGVAAPSIIWAEATVGVASP
eukprot:jgi/Tetstr1/439209/TSEL_027652.t1